MIYYNPEDNTIGILEGILIKIEEGRVYRVLTDKWVKIGSL